jgi:hypothetical protein
VPFDHPLVDKEPNVVEEWLTPPNRLPTPQTVSRKTTSAGNTTSQIVNARTDKAAAAVA